MDRALGHGNGCNRGTGKKKKAHTVTGSTSSEGSKKRTRDNALRSHQKQSGSVQSSPPPRKSGGTRTRPAGKGAYLTPPPRRQPEGPRRQASAATGRCDDEGGSVGRTPPRPGTHPEVRRSGGGAASGADGAPRAAEHAPEPFEVGTVVFVQDRQWPGRNDPGGVARVVRVHRGDAGTTYDVRYVIEARREQGVEGEFVARHAEYVSPAKEGGLPDDADGARERRGRSEEGAPATADDEGNGDSVAEGRGARSDVEGGPVAGDEARRGREVDEDGRPRTEYERLERELLRLRDGGDDDGGRDGGDGARRGQEVDGTGRPPSEYERLRLRNLRRNQARLAQRGSPPRPGASRGENHNGPAQAQKGGHATDDAKRRPQRSRARTHPRPRRRRSPRRRAGRTSPPPRPLEG